ncbi:M56 family metallopeptidase [Nonomuraea indica]|uniref:M56 family metallopeptidase n=1 Tax=Nonomuraea indica TaxID=1581193 RepID=UPI000C798D56|nr:M56 family metallopeptidase [Nonomuraea indica]
MTAVAVLAAYPVVAAIVLPRLLSGGGWAERAPRLAILLWLAACGSVVVSVLLAAFALAVPASVIGHGLAALFAACAAWLTHGPGMTTTTTGIALAVAGAVAARIVYRAAVVFTRARTERRRHAEMLALLGRHDGLLDAIVVDYDERLAYCLPGRHGKAVITTGALRNLSLEQVAAVLAHEQAHLRGRHHLVLAVAETLATAFPGVPLFERARAELARLIELLADDVAARRHPRVLIATALVGLATGRAPAFALGAGGDTALARVRRMLNPEKPLARRQRLAGSFAIALLLAGPAVVALLPGLSSFLVHHCHRLLGL